MFKNLVTSDTNFIDFASKWIRKADLTSGPDIHKVKGILNVSELIFDTFRDQGTCLDENMPCNQAQSPHFGSGNPSARNSIWFD